jgi:hypothetical protein
MTRSSSGNGEVQLRLALAVLCFLAASSASAQVAPGTWVKRDRTRDTVTMMIVEREGPGLRITYRLMADAKPVAGAVMTLVTLLDGADAPLLLDGKPGGETIAMRRIDANHTASVLKFEGRQFGTSKSELSPDGKTMKLENEVTEEGFGPPLGTSFEYWDKR